MRALLVELKKHWGFFSENWKGTLLLLLLFLVKQHVWKPLSIRDAIGSLFIFPGVLPI